MLDDKELQPAEGAAITARLREELARRRLSRQALADMARISLSTLEKALAGNRHFTLATVVRLEDALGLSLRDRAPVVVAAPGLAPEEMGAYARPAIKWIEDDYLTLRPSFGEEGAIYAYRTSIFWDEALGHLCFSEADRVDGVFAQSGHVSMPNLSGHIYLVTSVSGQYRLIILGRATRERRMFGLLSTLQVGAGSQLVPVAAPIALVPQDQVESVALGLISPDHAMHGAYQAILAKAVQDDFCRLRDFGTPS